MQFPAKPSSVKRYIWLGFRVRCCREALPKPCRSSHPHILTVWSSHAQEEEASKIAEAVAGLQQEHAQTIKAMHRQRAELESQRASAAAELAEVCCHWGSLK